MLDMELTPEQQQLKKDVRHFVAKHITPVAKHYDETGDFPLPVVEEAAKAGLLKTVVPRQYGGPGLDALSMAIIMEELSRGCAGMATTIGGNGLSSYPVLLAAHEELKRQWFQYLLDGKLVGFALTEPAAGSDAGAVRTTAVPEGGEYVLNGSKCFITTGQYAAAFTVFASTNPAAGVKGLSAFLVEGDCPGLSPGKHENKMGIRASNTVELSFHNVRIPRNHLIGQEGEGFQLAMKTLDSGRTNVAAMAVGLAQAALEAGLDFVKSQTRGGRPLAASQYIQFKIADLSTAVEAARNMVYKACYLKDSGKPFSKEAAMAKTFCTDTAMQVTSEAVDLLGIYGYLKESPVEKLLRDVKVMQIYEGTNQIQRIVTANQILRS
ncbi:acyl-CoA dehydrogenase family protein [Desulfitobacterium chlororespirans]|uniref:Acyl-CoA dehydrogenase n=1 Tax=Desulfitobacterium chlororespirans DSM 11544 TaxID=1121395 RepID=A0A1M7SXU7_9FIRM|nr:acyl-CoA dehydrogenase family protein [Desulfitobacterium chlororespirans]SHN63319.1 Acyl-CoA dehydrogenase [Desulfitobacterium chlororespirans DSM 11544]